MLLPEQVQRLVELALAEFAPEWQVTGLCSELSLHNPDHWVSGLGTFGLILRNRNSRSAKVLGWRTGDFRSATYHRGISYRVLEAYADRGWAQRTRRRLARDAAKLDRTLAAAGLAPAGGTDLFRLVEAPAATRIFERLAQAGVLCRPFVGTSRLRFGLPGRPADFHRLSAALGGLA